MSDLTVSFPAFEQPITVANVRHRRAPALRQNRNHTVSGIWLLAAGLYGTHDFMVRCDLGMSELVAAIVRHPQGTTSALGAPTMWCAMALFGGLLVAIGLRKARAPHNAIGVIWLFCLIGGCTYALVDGAYLDAAPVTSWYLRGLYLATLAASVMELFLFMRSVEDDARGVVRPVERRPRPWQDGYRHQF
jgi:hypothetical protein